MLTPTEILDELLYKNKIIGITYQNCRRQPRDRAMMLAIHSWYWSLTTTTMVAETLRISAHLKSSPQ